MAGPADTFATILGTAPKVGYRPPDPVLSGGYSLRVGKMTDAPDRQIVCYDTGGRAPNPGVLVDQPNVQVQVRGAKDEYINTYMKAKEVKDRLLGFPVTTVGDLMVGGIVMVSDVAYVHHDANDRPVFAINFAAIVEPAVSTPSNRTPL